MATPMTAAQAKAQLVKWNVPFTEVAGWETWNRNAVGAWGPVHGFMWHHSGVDPSNGLQYVMDVLRPGDVNLPGPWCNFSIGPSGMVYLVGWGRANHAGGGDQIVLNHVINEDYSGLLVPTKGNADGIDGNARFYGVEIQYSGSHAMAPAQYDAALKLTAAILDFHQWSPKSVIGHGEWSNTKWDPGISPNQIMDMPKVRTDIGNTKLVVPTTEAETSYYYQYADGSIVERVVAGLPSLTHPTGVTLLTKAQYDTAMGNWESQRQAGITASRTARRTEQLNAYNALIAAGIPAASAQSITGYTP